MLKRTETRSIMGRDGDRTELRCPFSGCDLPEMTHVVDVKWETDQDEGDRKRLRLEVRCENGHGFFLDVKNHAGYSYLQWEILSDNRSPFAPYGQDVTW